MIFYFSGTGNSLYVAQTLAKKQNIEIVSIADCIEKKKVIFVPYDGEPVGFVFPVYFWGPPAIVLQFIKKLQLARKNNYIFAIATCGKDIGDANDILRDVMMENRIPLNAEFSVVMPNKNVMFSRVPLQSTQSRILSDVDEQLVKINEFISKRRSALESNKGKFSFIKTKIINPLYNNYFRSARKFRCERRTCNGCGVCAEICPVKNITIQKRRPVWGKNCTNCFACYHRCPRNAIEYGSITYSRGQYYNSNMKNDGI